MQQAMIRLALCAAVALIGVSAVNFDDNAQAQNKLSVEVDKDSDAAVGFMQSKSRHGKMTHIMDTPFLNINRRKVLWWDGGKRVQLKLVSSIASNMDSLNSKRWKVYKDVNTHTFELQMGDKKLCVPFTAAGNGDRAAYLGTPGGDCISQLALKRAKIVVHGAPLEAIVMIVTISGQQFQLTGRDNGESLFAIQRPNSPNIDGIFHAYEQVHQHGILTSDDLMTWEVNHLKALFDCNYRNGGDQAGWRKFTECALAKQCLQRPVRGGHSKYKDHYTMRCPVNGRFIHECKGKLPGAKGGNHYHLKGVTSGCKLYSWYPFHSGAHNWNRIRTSWIGKHLSDYYGYVSTNGSGDNHTHQIRIWRLKPKLYTELEVVQHY